MKNKISCLALLSIVACQAQPVNQIPVSAEEPKLALINATVQKRDDNICHVNDKQSDDVAFWMGFWIATGMFSSK